MIQAIKLIGFLWIGTKVAEQHSKQKTQIFLCGQKQLSCKPIDFGCIQLNVFLFVPWSVTFDRRIRCHLAAHATFGFCWHSTTYSIAFFLECKNLMQ